MALRVEDYALIGDCHTAALVGRDGSIDWLCFPRFDSSACFAALLGTRDHGRWQIAPATPWRSVDRRYRGDTLILETEFRTEHGRVRIVDCMSPRTRQPQVVRVVEGLDGTVDLHMELVIRFDYGRIVPWVRQTGGALQAVAGPDSLCLRTPITTRGEDLRTIANFTVHSGEKIPFALTWYPSHEAVPDACDVGREVSRTEEWWTEWVGRCKHQGPWRDAVVRSLITLKALTYAPTGGVVAAATTSLPEQLGGRRNWDYRFCWLRDTTFTLYALMLAGYEDEAQAWREWFLRAVAGDPTQLQIMYGLAGERRLPEWEIAWLPGYEGSTPVRVGNAAHEQLQLDVFGEIMDALHFARRAGHECDDNTWSVQCGLLRHLEKIWREPDEGIWEVRGTRRHFTHSKVMAWVAFDRAVKQAERFGFDGPIERWRQVTRTIHDEVCGNGFSREHRAFVQSYGSQELDASVLMFPLVGFLPATDPRMRGSIEAIQRSLVHRGLVERYATASGVDGLPPGEGTFLPCSFWLADNLALLGEHDQARRLFEDLLALRNDVGLLAEEYDPRGHRQLGNFPQAFTHVSLINTAFNLTQTEGPARHRAAA